MEPRLINGSLLLKHHSRKEERLPILGWEDSDQGEEGAVIARTTEIVTLYCSGNQDTPVSKVGSPKLLSLTRRTKSFFGTLNRSSSFRVTTPELGAVYSKEFGDFYFILSLIRQLSQP